jgi:branched-chain amino acid transport system substrate-binding protein
MSKYLSSKLLSILIVLLIVFSLGSIASAQEDTVVVEPDGVVKIGLAAALSGEGLAPLGEDIMHGAEIAIANRPVVVIDDVEFAVELDAQDSQCSAEGGQPVANRFTTDESIVGVVGHMCSSSVDAAMPIYDAAGYTTISPSATGDELTQRESPSFNRTAPRDGAQGFFVAQFLYDELGVTKIATIHDGSVYAEGLVAIVTENFEELGGEVVAADAVVVGDTDFRALLEDIAQEDPELIYMVGFPAESARIIQQRADAGLEDVPFMGADGIAGTEVIELAGEDAEGIYASKPIAPTSEALDAYLEQYEDTYGMEPPAPYGSYAHDATNLLLDAVEAVGELDDDGNLVISREALAEYVRTFEPVAGISGYLIPDGTGETNAGIFGFFQVQDGEFVQVMVYGLPEEDVEEESSD